MKRLKIKISAAIKNLSMAIEQIIATLFENARSQSRSTILRPLSWLAGICVAALLGSVRFNSPAWLIVTLTVAFALAVVFYLGSYLYCLLTGKIDALRTERYSIQKLAIQRGYRGDSNTGLFEIGKGLNRRTLPAGNESAEEVCK
jgi:hypothetical protein